MPANTYGRQVVVPLTNKSGGQVIAGDVVVVDTTNNDSFTTSTAGSVTTGVGVAQETIASNATGRVCIGGYVALVNVNASVTRGNYGKTYTVAKQATDAGASRVQGTFCQFLTGGTTPDAYIYQPDLGGASLTNPMTTGGDIIYGGASGTPTRLANGSSGQHLNSTGSTTAPTWVYPPGYELDYVEKTTNTTLSATTEGTATTIITSSSITFDGAAVIMTFYSSGIKANATAGADYTILLRDDTGTVVLGDIAYGVSQAANDNYRPVLVQRRFTPAAGARIYSIRGFSATNSPIVLAGAGGTGNTQMPAFIRFQKV